MLTVKQLSEKLGISQSAVCAYASRGRIVGATKFGRAWMFEDDATVTTLRARFRKLKQQGGGDQSPP